jgi:hypothetical protein
MTWTKLGDEHGDEAWQLSDAAWRTHVEALLWSARLGLDLQVPKRHLPRFAFSERAADGAAELCATGWWADDGDTWDIGLHRPEWQLESVVIEHRRQGDAVRQRRSRLHKAGQHDLCLPAHCPEAVTRDGMRDATRDPGRVGSGRYGTGNPHQQEREEDTSAEPADLVLWPVPDKCSGCDGPLDRDMTAAGERAHPDCAAAA